MAKYKVLSLLWSPSQSKYLEPGEVVEFGDEIGMMLLNKGVIEPAKYSRKSKKNMEVKGNGTDG